MFCECTDVGRETQYSARSSPTANQTGEAHGNPWPSAVASVIYAVLRRIRSTSAALMALGTLRSAGSHRSVDPSSSSGSLSAICRTQLNVDGALLHSPARDRAVLRCRAIASREKQHG